MGGGQKDAAWTCPHGDGLLATGNKCECYEQKARGLLFDTSGGGTTINEGNQVNTGTIFNTPVTSNGDHGQVNIVRGTVGGGNVVVGGTATGGGSINFQRRSLFFNSGHNSDNGHNTVVGDTATGGGSINVQRRSLFFNSGHNSDNGHNTATLRPAAARSTSSVGPCSSTLVTTRTTPTTQWWATQC